MALLSAPLQIEEPDGALLRARRTAGLTRVSMGVAGIAMVLAQPQLLPYPALGVVGFATIMVTAVLQIAVTQRRTWAGAEEALSGLAGLLIVGLGGQQVTVLSVLWLVAVVSGVMARGGRVHWLGRNILLGALALPVIRFGHVDGEYACLFVATMGLLFTSGRLTRELNNLLRQARLQADSAETLLLAGDIAQRVADRGEREGAAAPLSADGQAAAAEAIAASAEDRAKLERVLAGEGLSMAVQPIVDIRDGTVHAYESLARFSERLETGSPLEWFALAERFGLRPELERACLGKALDLFIRRPPGTSMSVNLSVSVLLEAPTVAMLEAVRGGGPDDLDGLIIEITEETLVRGDMQLLKAIAPLRARGACLAVDDMGAGYSGLRQITTVHPGYLKLDRSLVAGIDGDEERAALVGALAGYSKKVGGLLIAEGVETAEELAVVSELGVPLVQGYYFSRPGEPWPQPSTEPVRAQSPEPVSAVEVGQRNALQPAA